MLILSLFTLSNCKRFDDTVLTIKLLSYNNDEPVAGIPITINKKKLKLIGSYSNYTKTVESYQGETDKNGIVTILIDNYNRAKYWFDVEVNPNLKKSDGFVFSRSSVRIEEYELEQTLIIRGSKIPIPDPITKGP